jgi:hypothetical protein
MNRYVMISFYIIIKSSEYSYNKDVGMRLWEMNEKQVKYLK